MAEQDDELASPRRPRRWGRRKLSLDVSSNVPPQSPRPQHRSRSPVPRRGRSPVPPPRRGKSPRERQPRTQRRTKSPKISSSSTPRGGSRRQSPVVLGRHASPAGVFRQQRGRLGSDNESLGGGDPMHVSDEENHATDLRRRSRSLDGMDGMMVVTTTNKPKRFAKLRSLVKKRRQHRSSKSRGSEDHDSLDNGGSVNISRADSLDSNELSVALQPPHNLELPSMDKGLPPPPPESGYPASSVRGVSFDLAAVTGMISYPPPPVSSQQQRPDYPTPGLERTGLMRTSSTDSMSALQASLVPEAGERARYSVYQGKGKRTAKRKFRVRPYHCFNEKSVYMTEEDIYDDSLQPSESFEFLKSYLNQPRTMGQKDTVSEAVGEKYGTPSEDGRIGALRLEVLGCIALGRNKPDVAVYAVCGDGAFCTDVIQGYRSPMWPSCSRRAAVFPLHHAFMQLYVAVFDVRARKNKENDVFCGRTVLDVCSLRPDTEYDVTLPLRASSIVYDRKRRGVIRIRFSLHWFSERAAVLSYFKPVKSVASNCPLLEGQPTIPCADPKTFRNVAVTVHGQDLPGKYTRNTFRATIREFNLYQVNFRYMIKLYCLDAVLYEKPWLSVYLFAGFMYCVIQNSIRLIPPIMMGYILILYVESYLHYVESADVNLGYKPVTLWEVAEAILVDRKQLTEKNHIFEPLLVGKKTKRRARAAAARTHTRTGSDAGSEYADEDNDVEIQPLDHREFPFSEMHAYPKLSVEDAIAPSSNNRRASTTRLHGRLSVYYSTAPASPVEGGNSGDDDDSDSDGSGDFRDDETIMSESAMGDSLYPLDYDDQDDDVMEVQDMPYHYQTNGGVVGNGPKSRVKMGGPQDSDTKGSKVPPQVTLKRMENLMHKLSRGVSVEMVSLPATEHVETEVVETSQLATTTDEVQAQVNAAKKRRMQLDEFDKLLGLHTRSANPIVKIMSGFLGPLMRIMRIPIFLCRIAFHVSTWRDPFLSFWVLLALIAVWFILLIFPWRTFFALSTLAGLGPQNILLRKYLEKKAIEKQKQLEDESTNAADDSGHSRDDSVSGECKNDPISSSQQATTSERTSNGSERASVSANGSSGGFRLFGRKRTPNKVDKNKSRRRASGGPGAQSEKEVKENESERPPFSSNLHGSSNSKKMEPRAVAVPYSRLKKDRFFDWPPDPTVSRATPLFGDIARFEAPLIEEPPEEYMLEFDESDGYPLRHRRNTSHSQEEQTVRDMYGYE